MEKTIEINGRKYRVKQTFRAVLDYEKNQKKQTVETLEDQVKMLFYTLKNANRKKTEDYDRFTMAYEAFLDVLDEDDTMFKVLTEEKVEIGEGKEEIKKK